MNRFKELRKSKNLTQTEFASLIHVDQSTVSKWEQDKITPDIQTMQLLAEFFGVSVDYLLGRGSNISATTINRNVVRIPIYGTIPAGVPVEMIEDSYIDDYEEIDEILTRNGNTYFGLKIKGDSMSPEFRNGDTIILKQQDSCESGEFCAVSINHTESTFKKVIIRPNGITLQPLNPAFEPMFYTNQEVSELPITILGVVKEVRRTY